jgi:hypothetical protein
MIKYLLLFLTFSLTWCYAGDSDLELNIYRHNLIEQSFDHSDSLVNIEIEKKSVFRAGLYSAVLPGAGQYYNGSIWKTILFAGIEAAAWTAYFVYESKGDRSDADMRGFADQNWSEHKYWSWIYDQAQQQGIEGIPSYQLTPRDEQTGIVYIVDFDREKANSLRYLEERLGHTHRLPETKTQQYYEMIYKYLTQFGNAWGDADFYTTYYGNNNTMTTQMFTYRDMRNQTNNFYDTATAAVNVILINHVISAIEAAWDARNINRDIEIKLSAYNRQYNDEQVQMYGINLSW